MTRTESKNQTRISENVFPSEAMELIKNKNKVFFINGFLYRIVLGPEYVPVSRFVQWGSKLKERIALAESVIYFREMLSLQIVMAQ